MIFAIISAECSGLMKHELNPVLQFYKRSFFAQSLHNDEEHQSKKAGLNEVNFSLRW